MKHRVAKQDSNKLYYYCKLTTAIEHILLKKEIRLSPLTKTNDPRENKTFHFCYNSNSNDTHNLLELDMEISKLIREDCKVICFSTDYKKYQGCHLSKMWAHYGQNHEGVCLEINKDKFILENNETISKSFFKKIIYEDYDSIRRPSPRNIYLEKYEQNMSGYIKSFKEENLDYFFFTKSQEWESESEQRLLYFSSNTKDECCKIENSLESIHLGIDFNDAYLPCIKSFSGGRQIFRMDFLQNGLICKYCD